MSIQNLLLGSLVSRGADRLLNPAKYRQNQFNLLTGGGYTGEDEEKDRGPTTFGGIAKQGIMSVIARALLGPVFGPLALTVGQNFVSKNPDIVKGLGFLNSQGYGDDVPRGPGGINLLELQKGIQSAEDDTDSADIGLVDAATADIQDYADIIPEDSDSGNGSDDYGSGQDAGMGFGGGRSDPTDKS